MKAWKVEITAREATWTSSRHNYAVVVGAETLVVAARRALKWARTAGYNNKALIQPEITTAYVVAENYA